jgi:hypothetical protein
MVAILNNVKEIIENPIKIINFTTLLLLVIIIGCIVLVVMKVRIDETKLKIYNTVQTKVNNNKYPNNKNNIESFINIKNNENDDLNDNDNDNDNKNKNKVLVKFIEPGSLDIFSYGSSQYLNTMNQININARDMLNRDEIYQKYSDSILSISIHEQINIDQFVRNLIENLDKQSNDLSKFISHWLPKSYIAKQKEWLESGMPHTHTNIIFMPQSWFNRPNQQTYMHELIHVHQRYKPDEYADLYYKWGFKHYPSRIETIKGLEQKVVMTRHNPDAMDVNWVWISPLNKKKYWITAEFNSIDHSNISLTDVSYLGYELDVDKSGNYYYLGKPGISLSNLATFQEFFGIINNHYHPNEIASQFGEYYLIDCLNDRNKKDKVLRKNRAYLIYVEHMNDVCSKY